MVHSKAITQDPTPGVRLLMFRGDSRTFTLSCPPGENGSAWLRTNIGHADVAREEVFGQVLREEPPLGRDWFDIPMKQVRDGIFEVTLPLCEVGHFEAKCYFLKKGEATPVWPEGSNTVINVEPADTCCANIIYNAFVRQFGPNKSGRGAPGAAEQECIHSLDRAGYTVIPKSGTFRDLIRELDFIIGELGCRVIQLLPVNPTPTTYARMGRFGSPFAALSFTAVDPSLAEFDARATPMEQFLELVDAIHERHGKVFIDIAINHTGWAAAIHETHPHWLVRGADGRIEVPGAWGVRWEDLTKLDYRHKDLWRYMVDVFLTWCRRGVDGFRCDAGYMIPVPVWKYIVASVRSQFPNTIFLLEGLGGKISVTRDILNHANFDWGYSELFQNYDRSQIESYLPGAIDISQSDGILVHFAETHDNLRLASRSQVWAKMRTALCALCSPQGAFGFANGVEWYAAEKINVHEAPSLNWGAKVNQVPEIQRLNTLLKVHPAFHEQTRIELIQQGEGNGIALLRSHLPSGKKLLIVANLDDREQSRASWDSDRAQMGQTPLVDLITGAEWKPESSDGRQACLLDPGQVLCLTADAEDIGLLENCLPGSSFAVPERAARQRLRAKALDVFVHYNGTRDLNTFDPDRAVQRLYQDPEAFCREMNPLSSESRVVTWQWPRDSKREVMIPPGHFLLVRSDTHFRARIVKANRVLAHSESLARADGSFFALFTGIGPPTGDGSYKLELAVYTPGDCIHVVTPLLVLTEYEGAAAARFYRRSEILREPLLFLGTNGRGGMLRAPVAWGELNSRYDAILSANLHPDCPEDRRTMLARCRAWLVFQDFSQDICLDCLDAFVFDRYDRGVWNFRVPTGQGEHVQLSIALEMEPGKNAARMVFYRHSAEGREGMLADDKEVRLIVRPDIEDRSFHETTKAYTGPEKLWPAAVTAHSGGFFFAPHPDRHLELRISSGDFMQEPEWQYMVFRRQERERGLDPDSDLFSPGYFSAVLRGSASVELLAHTPGAGNPNSIAANAPSEEMEKADARQVECLGLVDALKKCLESYVVHREDLKTVIAGYPWFLDWGRDSLIFVRGLIAEGETESARAIIKLFGQFEKQGTLPNMIRGRDAGNRDTSDAPLWLFVACAELVRGEGDDAFLDEPCEGRTLRQILVSIGLALISGTPNGIRIDPETGLVFSPSHFTWMDTNHPAGTPREGYPVEIQALWYHALCFLSRIDPERSGTNWEELAARVKSSIMKLYVLEEGWLSDCLHAAAGVPASRAEPDDALRPNQLLAVTLGAVSDPEICRRILTACEELLVPGGIRSLADRPVRRPLPVYHNGALLNDPHLPYWGTYQGDEDTRRKPAYHNGTAWTWLFPSFPEAWVKVYGEKGKKTALAWLASAGRNLNRGCIGHVPEILDGDFPHTPRGCDAQAWGASELLRVLILLTEPSETGSQDGRE